MRLYDSKLSPCSPATIITRHNKYSNYGAVPTSPTMSETDELDRHDTISRRDELREEEMRCANSDSDTDSDEEDLPAKDLFTHDEDDEDVEKQVLTSRTAACSFDTDCSSDRRASQNGDDASDGPNRTIRAGDSDEDSHDDDRSRSSSSQSSKAQDAADLYVNALKYLFSGVILCFSVAIVMAAIFADQTVGTRDRGVPPALACGVFWVLLVWLGVMEGGQGCLVGLKPIDRRLYADSHPVTHRNTGLAHDGDNLERFIIGRQFLVVLVVFALNMVATVVPDADVFGLPDVLHNIFISSGVAVILTTIVVGQLTAQVTSALCMLDFINSYFMLYFVTYISLAIEFSGLLHCVYLVQIFFAKVSGQPIESREPARSRLQNLFFWARVLMSSAVLSLAFAVTLTAMFDGLTTAWDGVPPGASVAIFFVLMCFVGILEGMQIALFAVVNVPLHELKQHKTAHATCKLAFEGQNLQAFLIGRQIGVTMCTFIIARITTLDMEVGTGENIFGVSDGFQAFLNTGLLGAVITTIVSSLAWRIVASSFAVPFLSNPLVYVILRLCLLLEGSGLCSAAWILAEALKFVRNMREDDRHIASVSKAPPQDLEMAEEEEGLEPSPPSTPIKA